MLRQLTDAEKIEAWDEISKGWQLYCEQGTYGFDWDYDSRPVMDKWVYDDNDRTE